MFNFWKYLKDFFVKSESANEVVIEGVDEIHETSEKNESSNAIQEVMIDRNVYRIRKYKLSKEVIHEQLQYYRQHLTNVPDNKDEHIVRYLKYPWELLLGNYKMKTRLREIINSRNIITIHDLMKQLPLVLEDGETGVGVKTLYEFNNYILDQISKASTLSSGNIFSVFKRIEWKNFYSKVDIFEEFPHVSKDILEIKLKTLMDEYSIRCSTTFFNRVGEYTLHDVMYTVDVLNLEHVNSVTANGVLTKIMENLIQSDLGTIPVTDAFLEANGSEEKKCGLITNDLKENVLETWIKHIDALKPQYKNVLLKRSQRITLQDIATETGVTRERIRQIESHVVQRLTPLSESLLEKYFTNRKYILNVEIEKLFEMNDHQQIFCYVIEKSDNPFIYVSYLDTYVKQIEHQNFEAEISGIIEFFSEDIGYVSELYAKFKSVSSDWHEEMIQEYNFPTLLTEMLKYKVTNNVYIPHNKRMPDALALIIKNHIDFDIKLDGDSENKEMKNLRELIYNFYFGIELPENNNALTSLICRSDEIILSDRGRYTHLSKVNISDKILESIYRWIKEANRIMSYKEIFARFQDILTTETNITNHNFLHGILKHHYLAHFNFSRDVLSPLGAEDNKIDVRVSELVTKKKFISIDQVLVDIPGMEDYQLNAILDRNKELIKVNKQTISTYDTLKLSTKEKEELSTFLKVLLSEEDGYISKDYLYDELEKSRISYLLKRCKFDEVGLYSYFEREASNEFIFARGKHIMYPEYNIYSDNTLNILRKKFIINQQVVSLKKLERFFKKNKLSVGFMYSFIFEVDREILRKSSDEYYVLENFSAAQNMVRMLETYLNSRELDYISVNKLSNEMKSIEEEYEWTDFLVEDLIRKYSTKYRLIDRTYCARHYVSSSVVPVNSKFMTYEELVYFELSKTMKKVFTRSEMFNILCETGLLKSQIPKDIIESKRIRYSEHEQKFLLI